MTLNCSSLYRSQKFLSKLPCSVFLSLHNRRHFVERLTSLDLKAMARSKKLWSCLPIGSIRAMMRKFDFGSKIDVGDVFAAAAAMSKAKSLDLLVAANVVRHQLPKMLKFWWTF